VCTAPLFSGATGWTRRRQILNVPCLVSATFDLSRRAAFAPVSHVSAELSVITSNLFPETRGLSPAAAPPSPPLDFEESSTTPKPGTSFVAAPGPIIPPNQAPIDDDDSSEHASLALDNLDIMPSSPMCLTLSDLPDDDEDLAGPESPSRRSFADLPEDAAMNEPSSSPPESPLLAGQPLLTLPGAEPDNSLITAETAVSDWSAASPPRRSGLGLFLPIQAASSNQPEASETHAIEPNLKFSTEAIARVDSREFEKLKSVRRRTWVSERKAKEDEVFQAKRAEYLAGRLSVAPPVP